MIFSLFSIIDSEQTQNRIVPFDTFCYKLLHHRKAFQKKMIYIYVKSQPNIKLMSIFYKKGGVMLNKRLFVVFFVYFCLLQLLLLVADGMHRQEIKLSG